MAKAPARPRSHRPRRPPRHKHPDYDLNVFINCPFDPAYEELFRAMVFTVYACGFIPQSAKGISNQNRRFERIIELIGESRYSLHDLCRSIPGQAPRNNMPLELGVFIGCWRFGTAYDYDKEYLILDKDATSYNQHTSDIKADDVEFHENNPALLIERVRDWLASRAFRNATYRIPGADILVERYARFQQDGPALAAEYELRFTRLKFPEYCTVVNDWRQAQEADYQKELAILAAYQEKLAKLAEQPKEPAIPPPPPATGSH